MTPGSEGDVVEHLSPFDFLETIDRLLGAITAGGLMLFARIDHAAGARDAGLEMPPTTVLLYGHPKGGTPLMLAAPNSALDLPLRVLVRQQDAGRVVVVFHPIEAVMSRAGVPENLVSRLRPAQDLILRALQR